MTLPNFEEKMTISYNNRIGNIVCITKHYFTFQPNDSNAIILIYKENWKSVTVLQLAQTP